MNQEPIAAGYRLGLDLGTNSIGWCALQLDGSGVPIYLLDAGVRILTPNEEAGRDPQSKNSLAAKRRAARAMRRRRDRFLRRQQTLMNLLVQTGLMPTDDTARKGLERLDPYWLRAAALSDGTTTRPTPSAGTWRRTRVCSGQTPGACGSIRPAGYRR